MRSTTSPYKGISSRVGGAESLQAIIKTLEIQNTNLVQQINILKTKNKKVIELQDKIDMILKHNTQLLTENQRLAKLINQKKSQVQTLRNKHDSVVANRNAASDLEIKRLINEIQKLKEESVEIQHAKSLQINQIKNQQHAELQNLKRNNLANAQKFQLQIRKLKEYCDKKDYEISDLKMKIARMGKQTQFQIIKLRQQKQRLRNDLQFQQNQHRKQIQSLKSKFDFNFHSEIQNLKKQHLNQVQTLDYQNSKLKQVINSKNLQLQQALLKHNKMRNHFQDSLQLMKKQNCELKQKLVQNEHISDLQLTNLRQKLEGIKQSQLALLKDSTNNQADLLQRQISKLRSFLDSRNQQMQVILKQKAQQKQSLQNDILKARAQLVAQLDQYNTQTRQHEQEVNQLLRTIKQKQTQITEMQKLLLKKIQILTAERQTSDSLLNNKQKQLDRQRTAFREAQLKLNSEVQSLKQQALQAKDQLQRTIRKSSTETEQQKKLLQLKIRNLETQVTSLQQQSKQKQSLISNLSENISLLNQQIKLTDQKNSYLQSTETQLRSQLRDQASRSDAKQKQLNRLIKQQIQRMQQTRRTQIDELKAAHENKIKTLKYQIGELQRNIDDKNRVINGLKASYQELVNNFEKVFAQEAARKNLDIKVPGWLPETLALKSLFDVFLKNKVLQYCS